MTASQHGRKFIRNTLKTVVFSSGVFFLGPSALKYCSENLNDDEKKKKAKEAKKYVLILPFHKMQIVEKKGRDIFDFTRLQRLLNDEHAPIQVEVQDIVKSIHDAAEDPDVIALFSDFGLGPENNFYVSSYAHLDEIRNAIKVFNESHRIHPDPNVNHDQDFKREQGVVKNSYAFAESFESTKGNPQYFLASQCKCVLMKDTGRLNLYGLGITDVFYKKTLEKYGIKAHVFKHGDYKTAPNIWTESGYTRAHKENLETILYGLENAICADIQASRTERKKSIQILEQKDIWSAIREYGTMTSENAIEIGLIDAVIPNHPILQLSGTVPGKSKLLFRPPRSNMEWAQGLNKVDDAIDLFEYQKKICKKNDSNPMRKLQQYVEIKADQWKEVLGFEKKVDEESTEEKEKISIVYINGLINAQMANTVNKKLKHIKGDDNVKSVILRINSPGGTLLASESIHAMCKDLGKPIVCSMGGTAASGGYYIASACDYIFALPKTITGSIGVYVVDFDMTGFFSSLFEASVDHVSTGPHSVASSSLSSLNEYNRANIQRNIDDAYSRFMTVVMEGRPRLVGVESVAGGRVWFGEQAVDVGLVDSVGGLQKAIAYAQANHTTNQEAEVVVQEDDKYGALRRFFSGFQTTSLNTNPLQLLLFQFSPFMQNDAEQRNLLHGCRHGLGTKEPLSSSSILLVGNEDDAIRLVMDGATDGLLD